MKNNRKVNIKSVVMLILVVSIFFITIGFSSLSTSLSINGLMSFNPVGMIMVTNITPVDTSYANNNSFSYTKDTTSVSFNLPNLSDSVSYDVTIRNFGQTDKTIVSIFQELFPDDYLTYTLENYELEDLINPRGKKVVRVTFKYKEDVVTPVNNSINVKLKYIFGDYTNINLLHREYDELVFNGYDYIDTGIKLYSEENINKNFEISFNVDEIVSPYNSQGTILNSMKEVSPYPGFTLRHQYNNDSIEFNSPSLTGKTIKVSELKKVYIKRYNDVYYIRYNDGALTVLGKSKNNATFDVPLTLGASLDSFGNPWRYFKGTLSNISITVTDQQKYIIKYHSNGGSGTMEDQYIRIDEETNLNNSTFTYENFIFDGWNTKADESGTFYNDGQSVYNIGANQEIVDLYAVWTPILDYDVIFDPNGGVGDSSTYSYTYGTSYNIIDNSYIRDGYQFIKWNTSPDGSGTDYYPSDSFKNLAKPNETVTLYAMWSKTYYEYKGEYVFDGTNYIDTGISLYSSQNINTNYEISFEIVSIGATGKQETLMNSIYEVKPWPGLLFRNTTSSNQLEVDMNGGAGKFNKKYTASTVSKVIFRRINGDIYLSINDEEFEKIGNHASITQFDTPVTFGASLQSDNTPFRYFKGTLKNLKVILYE